VLDALKAAAAQRLAAGQGELDLGLSVVAAAAESRPLEIVSSRMGVAGCPSTRSNRGVSGSCSVCQARGTARLPRRGFALEWTLAWNVVGIVVLGIAARSVALARVGLDSLIEIGASSVVN